MYRIILFSFFSVVLCDLYVGMFKKNDLLVAQDALYKERIPYGRVKAKYGRLFKCPITYFHVVDRLGIGRGPKVEIVRGGLQRKYVVLRLISVYNFPISVNVYVGCQNKLPSTTNIITTKPSEDGKKAATTSAGNSENTVGGETVTGNTTGDVETTTKAAGF